MYKVQVALLVFSMFALFGQPRGCHANFCRAWEKRKGADREEEKPLKEGFFDD
jgi:hypothetical protein